MKAPDEAFNDVGPVPGSRWRDSHDGKIVRILESEVHGTGPSWTVEGEPGSWHYCFLEDFIIWKRFELVSMPEGN